MRGAFSSSFKTKAPRVLGTLPKTCEGTVRVFGVWASWAKARHGHHRLIGSNFQGDSNDQKTIRAEKNGTQDRFLSLHCRTSICISHPSHLTIIHTKAWLGGRGMIYQAIP